MSELSSVDRADMAGVLKRIDMSHMPYAQWSSNKLSWVLGVCFFCVWNEYIILSCHKIFYKILFFLSLDYFSKLGQKDAILVYQKLIREHLFFHCYELTGSDTTGRLWLFREELRLSAVRHPGLLHSELVESPPYLWDMAHTVSPHLNHQQGTDVQQIEQGKEQAYTILTDVNRTLSSTYINSFSAI